MKQELQTGEIYHLMTFGLPRMKVKVLSHNEDEVTVLAMDDTRTIKKGQEFKVKGFASFAPVKESGFCTCDMPKSRTFVKYQRRYKLCLYCSKEIQKTKHETKAKIQS